MSSSFGRSGGPAGADPALAILGQLTQLSRAVAQAASLDQILQLAATQGAAMLDADRAVLMLVGDGGMAHVRASEGMDPAVAAALSGTLNEQFIAGLERTLGGASRSFMAVPLIVQGNVTGLLAVARPRRQPWSAEEEALLAAIADQSAAPIEIARLSEEVRQARLVAENLRLEAAERAARAELETERARLATVIDNIPSGVVLAEAPSGRIVFCNRLAARLTGVEEAEFPESVADLGQARCFGSDGHRYAPEEWPLARALGQGEVVSAEEIELERPDGSRVILSINAAPVRDQQGTIVAAVTTFQDVTQRRRVEHHLRQVQQMEAVGRLAGGVAHETNNQMSVVLASAIFALRRDDLPDPVRRDVELIRRAAERTAAVTAQLLAFSRRQILRPEILNLDDVIREFAPVLRRTLGEDSVLVINSDRATGTVRADRGQIEQVLLNLALNARDAMPGGGRLTIETCPATLTEEYGGFKDVTARPGKYVLLAVSDTGVGMDQQTLSHLFEPFFTTKPVGQGTGLGLSSVYGIVKQSDGYVWAQSAPGQGATFEIYLPSIEGSAAWPQETVELGSARPGEVVMVVEDEEMVRVMAGRMLESEGYEVMLAADGREALELIGGGRRVDLVISDVAMPGMNGRELTARLHELRPGLPVLFMSGYTDDEMVRRGLIEPRHPFLSKPFTPEVLAAKARQLIDETTKRVIRR